MTYPKYVGLKVFLSFFYDDMPKLQNHERIWQRDLTYLFCMLCFTDVSYIISHYLEPKFSKGPLLTTTSTDDIMGAISGWISGPILMVRFKVRAKSRQLKGWTGRDSQVLPCFISYTTYLTIWYGLYTGNIPYTVINELKSWFK